MKISFSLKQPRAEFGVLSPEFTQITFNKTFNIMKINTLKKNASKRRIARKYGFTIMEIVIVLAIIGIIMAVAVKNLGGAMGHADKTKAQSEINQLVTALTLYKSDAGRYPTQEQGLKALQVKPTSPPVPRRWSKNTNISLVDPWENEYIYKFPGTYDKTTPEVISKGPNGVIDSPGAQEVDDISSQDHLRP